MSARHFLFMIQNNRPQWLKNRGYLHVGPKVDLNQKWEAVFAKITDRSYIAKHAFLPLLHAVINERRYKKIDASGRSRAHSQLGTNGKVKKNYKSRPLHFATHVDAMIFSYYAEVLLNLYETKLASEPILSQSIIAYRKIPENANRNKSTINFAFEVFSEIKKRAYLEDCAVVKLDIKSFFSNLNHNILKNAWINLLQEEQLPPDHYNVFKAVTKFSYILRDDLRLRSASHGRKRLGFDEKKIAESRKKGILAFFENPQELKERINNKEIRIHKFPFRDKDGFPMGIPQGLPISAVLANIYLFDFDYVMIKDVVEKMGGYYRRYSDDIIIACKATEVNRIEEFVYAAIKDSKVEISVEKTEKFVFEKASKVATSTLISLKIDSKGGKKPTPFTYLGFEFYGEKILIKSSNLSKFYRRMIYAVKSKASTARKSVERSPGRPLVIFRRQLYKLYTSYPLSSTKIYTKFKWLEKNKKGEYFFKTKPVEKKQRSNYLSYVKRASEIMQEPAIKHQIRNHYRIFNQAIYRHLKR